MRASVRVVACVVVMLVGTPQPAHAIWRWLEHMSGPGWYDGFSIEFKRWARYPGLPESEEAVVELIRAETSLTRLRALQRWERQTRAPREKVLAELKERIQALEKPARALAEEAPRFQPKMVIPTISTALSDDRRVGDISQPRKQTFGFSAGMMWSTINRLRYDPSVNPEDTQVWVLTGGPFYDRRLSGLLDRVEVGGSAEGYLFLGKTTKTMVRLALEPRATVTLGTIRDDATGNPSINFKVRVGALWVLPGFDTEDFGALPGERLGPEVLTSIRLVVDFECLPWKRRSC